MHELGGFFAEPAPVPARRLRHHRQRHRARPYGARPWRGRFRAVQGERHRPGVRGRGRRQISRGLAVARRAGHRSSTPSSTRPTARSAPTCAKPAALLAASADYKHSYPHSWRSKAKVIYRCTPQWFMPMDTAARPRRPRAAPTSAGTMRAAPTRRGTARRCARLAMRRDRRHPLRAAKRAATASASMVEGRPDWVLSRQRAWGVPIALVRRPQDRRISRRSRGQRPHRRRGQARAASTPGSTPSAQA